MNKRSLPLRIVIQALLVVIAVSVLIPFVYIEMCIRDSHTY